MAKRKLQKPVRSNQPESVNKKALYWTSGIFVGLAVILSILLILDL
ncbi:hypothetical protein [Marinicrinis sediminis]|uniref:Uncharacterized protein n=1 Tax=Marinicrinis sediminis TaxID=1652465 RepID=A0ABW5RA51_9BACL